MARFITTCDGLTCTFDASGSIPGKEDEAIQSYDWRLGDGIELQGRIVNWTYDSPGSYVVELTVRGIQSRTITRSILVETASDPPMMRWSSSIPERGLISQGESRPLYGEERVFVTTTRETHASTYGIVDAFHAGSGDHLWKLEVPGPLQWRDAVQGFVFAQDRGGTVHSRSADDGAENWQTDVDRRVLQALVVPGIVILRTSAGTVTALDAADGRTLWRDEGSTGRSMEWTGTALYTTAGRSVSAHDPENGRILWTRPIGHGIDSLEPQGDAILAIGARQAVTAIQGNGSILWSFRAEAPWSVPPTLSPDSFYYVNGADRLAAVDLQNGTPKWEADPLVGLAAIRWAGPERIVAEVGDDRVAAWEAESGALEWQFESPRPLAWSVVGDQETVYLGTEDGAMLGVHAGAGTESWRYEVHDRGPFDPTLGNDILYYMGYGATIYALDVNGGQGVAGS